MNHANGVGSIARPVDQQSSALPLCYTDAPLPGVCKPQYTNLLITYGWPVLISLMSDLLHQQFYPADIEK